MVQRIHLYIVVILIQVLTIQAFTHGDDVAALQSLKDAWENEPPSWVDQDPCGDNWEGIICTNNRVVSITLSSIGLSGHLPGDIKDLAELQTLDLSYNKGLKGNLPESIGNLKKLSNLILAGCSFSGPIPESIGSLKHLVFFLVENNQLNGSIPNTLGLVRSLQVVRLDNNLLTGPVPENLNNLSNVSELYLSNNRLIGPLPNLTGMDSLNHVDMSNNFFDPSDVPSWFWTLRGLTTLIMERTQIEGQLPPSVFSLPQLQTIILRNNRLAGTLDIGFSYSNRLQMIDLQDNLIEAFTEGPGYKFKLILKGNRYCQKGGSEKYCAIVRPPGSSYSTPPLNCSPTQCGSDHVCSPTCRCAYPYSGNLLFRAPSFFDLDSSNFVLLQQSMVLSFQDYNLPVDSVSLSNPITNLDSFLVFDLQIFPSGHHHFNRTGISAVGFFLSNQTYKPPATFGPFYFIGDNYQYFEGESAVHKSLSPGMVVEAAVAGSGFLLLLLLAGVYVFRQKQRAKIAAIKKDPFASWDPNNDSGGVPQIKGVICFSFEELKQYTDNFSKINEIGSGGYGKVYKGTVPSGQWVAIKRARKGSMQGALEFKTEIELLSRVHHKYLVKLVGFCFKKDEQMLVYEYIPNGTLQDSLSGKSGIKLDWMRRLQIALGAARGFQYLHDLADPPIIHRDIKSNNILLDEHLNAKVADFGISKPLEPERGYVTTQVKGTPGYLDPEYFMTQQLTEKSDVYSFGVLLLELITARNPYEREKHIVNIMRQTIDKTKDLYNLHSILDNTLGLSMPPRSLEKFVDLAMRCVEEAGIKRPTMSDVVKEIENVVETVGLNSNAVTISIPANNEEGSLEYSLSNECMFSPMGVIDLQNWSLSKIKLERSWLSQCTWLCRCQV